MRKLAKHMGLWMCKSVIRILNMGSKNQEDLENEKKLLEYVRVFEAM